MPYQTDRFPSRFSCHHTTADLPQTGTMRLTRRNGRDESSFPFPCQDCALRSVRDQQARIEQYYDPVIDAIRGRRDRLDRLVIHGGGLEVMGQQRYLDSLDEFRRMIANAEARCEEDVDEVWREYRARWGAHGVRRSREA